MPKFTVRIGRDARAWFEGLIEADSAEDIQNAMSRHGLDPDFKPVGGWQQLDPEVFDQVEEAEIADESGAEAISSYSEAEGWTPSD